MRRAQLSAAQAGATMATSFLGSLQAGGLLRVSADGGTPES